MGQKPKHGLGSSFGSKSSKRLQPKCWLGLQSVHRLLYWRPQLLIGNSSHFFVIWTSPRSATCYIGASKQSQRERASKMEVTTFCNLIIEGKSLPLPYHTCKKEVTRSSPHKRGEDPLGAISEATTTCHTLFNIKYIPFRPCSCLFTQPLQRN